MNIWRISLRGCYLRDLCAVLLNTFLRRYSNVSQFNSYADSCNSGSYYSVCTHCSDTDCTSSTIYTNGSVSLGNLHHKNITNIMARYDFPNLSESVLLTFIGHNTCTKNGTSHGGGYFGLTYSGRGIISITNFSSVASESKTTMHEIGHLFGAPDHYGGSQPTTKDMNDSTSGAPYSSYCIYGEDKENADVMNNYIICDGCRARMQAQASRFSHN